MTIIYGGSFNPPTKAHFEIAKYIMEKFPSSEFYFLPTNNSYNKNDLKDFNLRVSMLKLMCEKLGGRAKVSEFEGELDKYYGTYYTLSHFKDPYFVMGADNLITIESWINYPKIVEDFKFIIIPRDGINVLDFINLKPHLKTNKDNFIILDEFSEINLSSSNYRETKDDNLLIEEVAKFIKENNLYKETEDVL